MLILSSTTDALQVITSSVADLDYVVSTVDKDNASPPVITPDTSSGTITTATTTTIGPTPASSHQIAIQSIELRNKHASTSNDVTVQHVKAGGTARQLIKVTLLAGEKLSRDKNGVWFHYDSSGGVKTAAAVPMTRTVLTAGSAATYTTPAGCRAIDVECVGGGGAGGGASLVASSGGAGGGGGSGGYTRKLIASPAATYTYTIGAGGTAGAAGANAGGAGGDTTFGTLTAKGGSGGSGCTSAAATRALGGAGGIAGSGGDINAPGDPGRTGTVMTAALLASGAGGSNADGGGAPGVIAQGAGTAASANSGSGGSGGASVSGGAAVAGGAGGSGVCVITEWY